MATDVDLSAYGRLSRRLRTIAAPNLTPLMATLMNVIEQDNRDGILAGLDKNGHPLIPVTYRPARFRGAKAAERRLKQAKGWTGRGVGPFAGLGAGANNNLSSAQYRLLSGPPLAPRSRFSRVITNLRTRFGKVSASRWQAIGYWDEVVDVEGQPFLHRHFEGAGRLPVRDLRGVRPRGIEKAQKSTRAFLIDLVRAHG